MDGRSRNNAVNRRHFLSQTGSGLLAAAIPASAALPFTEPTVVAEPANSAARPFIPSGAKKNWAWKQWKSVLAVIPTIPTARSTT